jgi:hypothetical protein
MSAPGPVPPPPPGPKPRGARGVIALRVLFVAIPLLSMGFLAWVSMLQLALARRRVLHWALFALVLGLTVGFFSMISGDENDNGWQSNTGIAGVVFFWLVTPVYFLAMDIHGTRNRPGPPPAPLAAPYPYAQPLQSASPYAYNPYRDAPAPTPAPPPAHPRIDQVRAELDELSALLRKQEGEH